MTSSTSAVGGGGALLACVGAAMLREGREASVSELVGDSILCRLHSLELFFWLLFFSLLLFVILLQTSFGNALHLFLSLSTGIE